MTQRRCIQIQNKHIVGFSDEINLNAGLPVSYSRKKRVSHIIPQPLFLRVLFIVLRLIVSDHSTVAAWTRRWRCPWLIYIERKAYGPFRCRTSAIEFEKQKIVELGIFYEHLASNKN